MKWTPSALKKVKMIKDAFKGESDEVNEGVKREGKTTLSYQVFHQQY